MKLQKIFLIKFLILMLVLMTFNPGFSQIKKGQTISFPGVIESVAVDLRFIVVNEARISIDSGTQVIDRKGNDLSLYDLKPKSSITIEVFQNPNGLLAKKITVNR
jgi:hypothetical protein